VDESAEIRMLSPSTQQCPLGIEIRAKLKKKESRNQIKYFELWIDQRLRILFDWYQDLLFSVLNDVVFKSKHPFDDESCWICECNLRKSFFLQKNQKVYYTFPTFNKYDKQNYHNARVIVFKQILQP